MPFDIQQQIQSFLANPENVEALKRVGIGAGAGAASLGLADAFTDDENRMPGGKTKSVLRSMLLGGALGGVGGAGYHAFQQASRPGGTAANGEEYYKGMLPKAYAKTRAFMGANEEGQWTAERRGGMVGGGVGLMKSLREHLNLNRKDTGALAMANKMDIKPSEIISARSQPIPNDPASLAAHNAAKLKLQTEIGGVTTAGGGKLAPEAQAAIARKLGIVGPGAQNQWSSVSDFRKIMGDGGEQTSTLGGMKAGLTNSYNHIMSKLTGGRMGKPFSPGQIQDPWNTGRGAAPGLGTTRTVNNGLGFGPQTQSNVTAQFAPSVARNMAEGNIMSPAAAKMLRWGARPVGTAVAGAGIGSAADWLMQRSTDQWMMNPAAKPFVK